MREMNVGIIGYGFMGKTHTYGYKTIPLYYADLPFRINLKGICTRQANVAEQARSQQGFEFATTDVMDILNHDQIDIVNICTPNDSHMELVIAALKANKHVYCEKPLAMNYDEAKQILTALEGCAVTTQITHQNRFFPATLRAKQILNEGRIGRVLSFRASYLHSGSVDPNRPIGWKQDLLVCGGGVLFDLGSHVFDLLLYLLGPYASVFAKTTTVYPKRRNKQGDTVDTLGEDLALVLVTMQDGSSGVIEASKIATGIDDELRFEIHGDKGALRFNLMEPNWLEFYDNTIPERPNGGYQGFTKIACTQRYESPGDVFPSPKCSVGWIRAHVHSLYSFLSSIYTNTPASPSFIDAAYIQCVMEQAYTSSEQGCWIDITY